MKIKKLFGVISAVALLSIIAVTFAATNESIKLEFGTNSVDTTEITLISDNGDFGVTLERDILGNLMAPEDGAGNELPTIGLSAPEDGAGNELPTIGTII